MLIDAANLGKRRLLYSGSSKKLYAADKSTLIMHYPQSLPNDIWRNYSSIMIWQYLSSMGIQNHFIQRLNLREQLIKAAETYPVFLKIYNIVPNSMQERLGIEEGTQFNKPLLEWHLKSQELGDPIISLEHIRHFNWLSDAQISNIQALTLRANDILQAYFYCYKMKLGDFKLEFGEADKQAILIDEISPETCNFWNIAITEQINKEDVYQTVKKIIKSEDS